MNIKKTMLKTAIVMVAVFTFISCDKDFETIGSNIIGEPGFNTDLYDDAIISISNHNLGPVQTNNLPVNLLGFYHDPFYGSQTASILTQLNLSTPDPDFGENPVLDSVVLHIPYFYSELDAQEGDTKVKYELDSVYGNSPIKLSVIESNLFLNEYDPGSDFEENQKYFSNMQPQVENNLGTVLFETDDFIPSAKGVTVYGETSAGEKDTIQQTPQLRIHLPVLFFQGKIIENQGDPELSNNNNFKNFFRGIYIKAEDVNNTGNLMILELNQQDAGITLYYSNQVADVADSDDDGDTEELIKDPGTYDLNFGIPGGQPAININLFEQEVSVPDDKNIYLKGGEGSMTIIELFDGPDSDGDGASDELEFIRDNNWLINEASLEFFVNQDVAPESNEPEWIYLYNLNTNAPLIDYYQLGAGGQPIINRDGSFTRDKFHVQKVVSEDENQVSYKIRITEYINRILNSDAENVKLGLVVSQNIDVVSNSALLNADVPELETVPTASVISPEGTILYGPKAENSEKQLKLRIYYTEPKE